VRYRLTGLPEVFNEELDGFPNVRKSLVVGSAPGVAPFKGGTKGMISSFALRKGIFLDDHSKNV
jgi:hypothetical protein